MLFANSYLPQDPAQGAILNCEVHATSTIGSVLQLLPCPALEHRLCLVIGEAGWALCQVLESSITPLAQHRLEPGCAYVSGAWAQHESQPGSAFGGNLMLDTNGLVCSRVVLCSRHHHLHTPVSPSPLPQPPAQVCSLPSRPMGPWSAGTSVGVARTNQQRR